MESLVLTLGVSAASAVLAFALGFYLQQVLAERRLKNASQEAKRVLAEAKAREKELLLEAKDEALKLRATWEREQKEQRFELQRWERRLQQKEDALDRKTESLELRERAQSTKEKEVERVRQAAEELRQRQSAELQRISGLNRETARATFLEMVAVEASQEAARLARSIELEARTEAEVRARRIIAIAIQRYAADQVSQSTVTVVPLPNDEMKGRIIGREGRNIRALESATGVDLVIDDTPEAVVLSSFDPIRREIARVALTNLILDGRIQPTRIEEEVEKARREVEEIVAKAGEQAAMDAGVPGLHPELVRYLGRLKFRTSYSQNVLAHSVEVAHLAAAIAAEIGADQKLARVAGLLHDLGKAADQDMDGSHAVIGAELVQRFGLPKAVVDAVLGHHPEQVEEQTLEAIIIQAADAVSGARPGARRETVEHYIKRLEALEQVANSFVGVEKSFAIEAGREIRIFVKPEAIDDLGAMRLAKDVVKKIEETLQYPGQIKVTVVRETRAVEYAK